MSADSPVLVVLGAGPGLGASVARRFTRDGYRVVLVSNEPPQLEEVADSLRADGIDVSTLVLDLTDEEAVRRAMGELERIDVLHFNPSAFRQKDPLHLTVDELFADLRVGVAPVLPALQGARPKMPTGARLLVTGSAAADKPWNEAPSLGMQKAALRNLVTSIDKTLAPDGIRAVAVQVNGVLSREGAFTPDLIAEAMFDAVTRSDDDWTPHVMYDG
ncbi:SDR family oxidoreductase [Aeromicrobium terrae]|uniref:SDR family oxidoreductase n=1 Tax=Aeromicrobium terrae TaxID=2498846 RepID=A0A5C8NK45_9ACTN|nr:SDR family oxidoreductase [Aeromicrobium terrae]TXL62139.1 SDR family oxidoreductase [Aeromicrobium terrae]